MKYHKQNREKENHNAQIIGNAHKFGTKNNISHLVLIFRYQVVRKINGDGKYLLPRTRLQPFKKMHVLIIEQKVIADTRMIGIYEK